MAGYKPDLGRGVDNKPTKVERGDVAYVSQSDPLVVGEQRTGPAYIPVIGKHEMENMPHMFLPLTCSAGGSHQLPPVMRVHMPGKEGPVNLCDKHYAKALRTGAVDTSRPSIEINSFEADPEQHHDIRKEDYKIELGKRNRDAASVFEATGMLRNVRTTGRPAIAPEDTEAALNLAKTAGGHVPKNHTEILNKTYAALLHSKEKNGGHPIYEDYANKATELLDPKDHRHIPVYFDRAQQHHKILTGESAVPPESREQTNRRASLIAENTELRPETMESYLQSDIPAVSDEYGRSAKAPSPRYD